jgi:hypothetical protein
MGFIERKGLQLDIFQNFARGKYFYQRSKEHRNHLASINSEFGDSYRASQLEFITRIS